MCARPHCPLAHKPHSEPLALIRRAAAAQAVCRKVVQSAERAGASRAPRAVRRLACAAVRSAGSAAASGSGRDVPSHAQIHDVGTSRYHAGSFASASSLSGGIRRPAQSTQAVAAPPMASPIKRPFINAAVTTADARTSFIAILLNETARRGVVSLYQWGIARLQQFVTLHVCVGRHVTDLWAGRSRILDGKGDGFWMGKALIVESWICRVEGDIRLGSAPILRCGWGLDGEGLDRQSGRQRWEILMTAARSKGWTKVCRGAPAWIFGVWGWPKVWDQTSAFWLIASASPPAADMTHAGH